GEEGGVVVQKVAGLGRGQGFNAATLAYGDLMEQGVIDPVKVTRSAVQNAASIAGMLLTTEALVADKPEKEAAADDEGHAHGRGPAECAGRRASRQSGVPFRAAWPDEGAVPWESCARDGAVLHPAGGGRGMAGGCRGAPPAWPGRWPEGRCGRAPRSHQPG